MSNIERAVIESIAIRQTWDEDPDTSYLEQDGFEDRLAAFEAGAFGFVGVRAVALIKVPTTQGGWIYVGEIDSPGLWGIESDSAAEHFAVIASEQLDELKDILVDGFGFDVADVLEAAPTEYVH